MPDFLQRLNHQPVWLYGTLLLTPLAAILLDIARGHASFTPRAVSRGYALYAFRLFFLLAVQFGTILVTFAVGPVWIFTFFLTVVDLIVMQGMAVVQDRSLPLLCTWCNVPDATCDSALIVYHLTSAALAFVVFRYGGRVFDNISHWCHGVTDRMAARIPTPVSSPYDPEGDV